MAEFNKIHAPNTETVLIKSDEDLVDVSSTLVRQMMAEDKSLENLLPKNAISEIEKILKSR
jgi:phosphopantetheine adenylyltransferase